MKLHAVTHSPFAARVRMALRVKGLPFEQVALPGGSTRSAEYLAINPIGKLPVLITDDGLVIAESETIIDYLEDAFPEPSLIPPGPADRVQMRNAIRTTELYVVPALFRLFGQMDPAQRDAGIVAAELDKVRNGLGLVQHFVDDAPFAAAGVLTKADCMILPTFLLIGIIEHLFAVPGMLQEFPRLAGYADKAGGHEVLGAVHAQTVEALSALMQ